MAKAKFPKLLFVWEEGRRGEKYKATADHPCQLPDYETEIASYRLERIDRLKITKKLGK